MRRRRISGFSSRAKLIAFAAVAVLLPTTVLSVIQYKSLVDLEGKTQAAVRENLRLTLQTVVKNVTDNLRKTAKASLIPIEAMPIEPNNTTEVENHFAAIKQSHPEINQLLLVCNNTCRGEKFALEYTSQGLRRINDPEQVWKAQVAFDRAKQSQQPKEDKLFYYDQAYPTMPSSPSCMLQTTVFYPLTRTGEEKPYGFVGMTLASNYLKDTSFPVVMRDSMQCPLTGERDSDLALWVYDENWNNIYASYPDAKYEVKSSFAPLFPKWYLAIGYKNTTVEALAKDNFQKTLMMTVFVLAFLILGIILILRATSREMKLAQAKSTFVSNVSHELKTPLALIRLFAETLELGRVKSPEKAQEYYGIINNESRRLTQLINNILDFSKIEAGRKEYEFSESDVGEVVLQVLRSYEYQIISAGFQLTTDIQRDLPHASIDQDAISQAVLNLLNNAVKYSDKVKEIDVRVRSRDGQIAIEIADKGIGIPRSEQDKVFEKFYRVSTGLVHNTRGTGLGLALVKHIVEAHHGKIMLDSTPGKGSRFTILIPAKESETARDKLSFSSGGYTVAEGTNS
jgi:signal transduction histidine kinase